MARSGNRGDLLAAGLGPGPVREEFASEVSEDATWVAAARDGDRAAFGRLYERYARLVHGVLLAKVPVSAVDDLLQDVFLRALRRLSTLRESGSFAAWLVTIARNLANDYHRRALPEEPLADDAPDNHLPENDFARGDQRAEDRTAEHAASPAPILTAIGGLPTAH